MAKHVICHTRLAITFSLLVLLLGSHSEAKITQLFIVDADKDTVFAPFESKVYKQSELPNKISIRADVDNPAKVKQIDFVVSDKLMRVERFPPYLIAGDRGRPGGGRDYLPWKDYVGGQERMRVFEVDHSGKRVDEFVVTYTIEPTIPSREPYLILVNADTEELLTQVVSGSFSFKRKDLPKRMTFSADIEEVKGKQNVVDFKVNGKLVRTERYAPYAIAGNGEKPDGSADYFPWEPPIGKTTIVLEQIVENFVAKTATIDFEIL